MQLTHMLGDLEVQRLGFGAMRITGEGIWGEPADRDECIRVLRRAVELGVNLIDTADSYGPEVSENLIAEALHPYPDGLVIATKGGFTRPAPNRWEPDCRPERLKQCCEGSLRRLKLERIDVYQLHIVDSKVPFEESLGALIELKDEGKIRHIGLSNVWIEHMDKAREMTEFVSVQNRYSAADRTSEPVLQACEQAGAGFLPWRPLAPGDLEKLGGVIEEVAAAHDATPNQVAIAWLLRRSPVMLPIPGTSKVAHLEENVAARDLVLTDDEVERITSAAS